LCFLLFLPQLCFPKPAGNTIDGRANGQPSGFSVSTIFPTFVTFLTCIAPDLSKYL
jgi:hypothetical protein